MDRMEGQEMKFLRTFVDASRRDYLFFNPVALVRKRTIPTERPPLVAEVSANFSG
jgi:hypothetical protein